MAVPPAKRARTGAEWGAVLGEAPDAALLAEVGKRNLSEAQLHAAVEASVATNYEVGKELGLLGNDEKDGVGSDVAKYLGYSSTS